MVILVPNHTAQPFYIAYPACNIKWRFFSQSSKKAFLDH